MRKPFKAQNIFNKFKKEGPTWLLSRLALEFRSPVFPVTKFLFSNINKLRIPYQKFTRYFRSHSDLLTVVYDLRSHPLTFDFAYFLIGAEIFANLNGKSKIFVWFIQRDETYVNEEEYSKVVDEKNRNWRFNNILLPIAKMHTSYSGYCILPKGASIKEHIKSNLIYPEGFGENYSPRFDYKEIFQSSQSTSYKGFQTPLQGKTYINNWINYSKIESPIVSITLRDYGYDPKRNSNIKEWVKFADWVSKRGYTPVFIPDVDACWQADERLRNHLVLTDVCWNLELRMAFYDLCFVSFFYSNGCEALAMLNKNIRSISMKPIIKDSKLATEENYKDHWMNVGERKSNFYENYQWLSWKQDSFENIKSEFLEFEDQFSDKQQGALS